jgi:uncharacterized protein
VDNFAGFTWLNEPSHAELRGSDLFVRTANATDYWRGTFYGFWRHSGHFSRKSVAGDFSAEVTVIGDFTELYDQAGLMVRLSESHWVKVGVEFTDGELCLSAVVTNDNSDWSITKLKADPRGCRIRLTRHGEAIRVQYFDWEQDRWFPLRLAYLPTTSSIDVGVMCCSPEREGFEVTFSDFVIGPPISRQLHD